MIQNERASRHEHVLDVARQMMTAARTAPKGKGVDIIEIAMVTGDDLKVLSDKMVAMVEEHGMKFFLRAAVIICLATSNTCSWRLARSFCIIILTFIKN